MDRLGVPFRVVHRFKQRPYATLCLLAFTLSLMLWAVSWFQVAMVDVIVPPHQQLALTNVTGTIHVDWFRLNDGDSWGNARFVCKWKGRDQVHPALLTSRAFPMPRWDAVADVGVKQWHHVVLPHWLLVMPFGIASAVLFCWRTRRKGDASPKCPRCDYDLRGNPAATTCPECGEPTPTIATHPAPRLAA